MSIEDAIAAAIEAKVSPVLAELRRVTSELEALRRALPPQLVTMTEAARVLDVSLSTIRRQVKDGTLPCRRVGRGVRIDLTDLRPTPEAEVAAGVVRLRSTLRGERAHG
jgi:excisionase family DNA binding protein